MKFVCILVACGVLMLDYSCTKEVAKTITNTIVKKDTLVTIHFHCDSMKNWPQSNNFEVYKYYEVIIPDSLYNNYDFVEAYLGYIKNNAASRQLPYVDAVGDFSIRYFFHRDYFYLTAYGDTTNINSSHYARQNGFSLIYKKK